MAKHIRMSYSKDLSEREKENAQIAYQIASEGMVLLENDGTLPVKPQHVALFGVGAAHNFKGGTGSGEVNERHATGIVEGLEKAGFTISTNAWIEDCKKEIEQEKKAYNATHNTMMNPLHLEAEKMINVMSDPFEYPYGRKITEKDLEESRSKICFYVISRQAGECYEKRLERGDLNLSEREIENLKICRAYYERLILIINIGGLIDLTEVDEIGVNAILHYGQQGQEGGHALADVLTGAVNPSGHLTDTWFQKYDQIPFGNEFSYLNGDVLHNEYKDGIFVGYRYFDSFAVNPRYPFGYGLSYTSFEIKTSAVKLEKSKVQIEASVRNTGTTAGKEVVQVYVSCPSGKLQREAQSLAAYGKTDLLKQGEICQIKTEFDLKDLAAYEESTARYLLEPGSYIIRVGNHSRNTVPAAVIQISDEVTVSQCVNIAPNPRKNTMQELTYEGEQLLRDMPENILTLSLDEHAIEPVSYRYGKPARKSSPEIDALLKKLTVKEKIRLCAGTGVMDMVGSNKFFDAPGAAAFSTSKLVKKGLANVVFADGPAGLRLTRTCGQNRKGKIKPADAMMEMMENQGGLMAKLMYADLTKDTPLYQFATAFPVGTSVAQTWNLPLVEKMGDAVGREMEEYGITYWLAPGMNIHKNPLCGRNYEYYSEDPVVTGKTAAALTRGVQRHSGCYVTIKHYCCNNQEFDRCTMSVYVNERPLREIYLKGFEIAVREGQAKGVMTSYNMTNEVYAAASEDFCMKVMRNEWGFDGVIMTDWFASWQNLADPVAGVKNGNDMHMPGGRETWKALERGLKAHKLTEEDLDWACANIIQSILNSNIQKEYMG